MVDITLDPNKEEEQENVATPASVPVAPVVQPVDETPEPPAQEEVPEPDIVVRPQLNTDEGRAKGLAPDPYMQSSVKIGSCLLQRFFTPYPVKTGRLNV